MTPKRKAQPEGHKHSVLKHARLRGLAYVNKRGRVVEGKETGSDCRCRKKCFEIINEEARMSILSKFLQLPSKDAQDLHLQRLIEKNEIKTRRPRNENSKQRAASFTYFVMDGNNRKKVCRSAFMSMHAVTQKRVFRITMLLLHGEIPRDKRGTNPNTRKIPEDVTKLISDHIQSFPLKRTHYGGKEVHYLDARLTIKEMHNMFVTKYPECGVKVLTDIFTIHDEASARNLSSCNSGSPQQDPRLSVIHPAVRPWPESSQVCSTFSRPTPVVLTCHSHG
ncbi:uncharacterized protein [Anabrus simplex]|uniref:uncharacterized protein n=1 Tax=Anabrus simplex TaxID=316456 RepID=UPI0035A2DEE9